MIKKDLLVILSFVLVTLLLAIFSLPNNRAYFIACPVGQGDAGILLRGSTQILVDGGPNNKVLNCLRENMPFWDRTIELVVNTHPEADHLTGILSVVRQYRVKQHIMESYRLDSVLFSEFANEIRQQGIPVYSPQKGDRLELAGYNLQVLWPEKPLGDINIWKQDYQLAKIPESSVLGEKNFEPNEHSIVMLVQYGRRRLLLAGDISSETENNILAENELGQVDILKVAHHGSKYSTTKEWLDVLQPKLAVISVGKNPWGHPTDEVLERLRYLDTKILRTDREKVKIKLD